jgi:hypothetical protein
VAVCLIAIMHYIVDEQEAHRIVDRLLRPMRAGSALALSTATADTNPEEVGRGIAMYNARGITSKVRTKAEVEGSVALSVGKIAADLGCEAAEPSGPVPAAEVGVRRVPATGGCSGSRRCWPMPPGWPAARPAAGGTSTAVPVKHCHRDHRTRRGTE